MSATKGWATGPVEIVPTDCPKCIALRAIHRPPHRDDPNQIPSQVRCPTCCLATFEKG